VLRATNYRVPLYYTDNPLAFWLPYVSCRLTKQVVHSRTLRPLQCESHPRSERNDHIMADEEEVNTAPEPVEEVEMSVLDALKEVSPSILYR
jgi:hypothetical protein